jgi:hypothetical protein
MRLYYTVTGTVPTTGRITAAAAINTQDTAVFTSGVTW